MQWLPGVGFLSSSQRGVGASSQFSAGSLSLVHIGSLLLVPFLLGGNTNFHMIVYQGLDNVQELTIGVGLVALSAALAYLPALARSFWAWCRRMANPERAAAASGSRHLAVWYVTAACGVALTTAGETRFASVLQHVPLYGGERLQNRNAELIDLALVVLLAFFVDDLVGRTRARVAGWRPLAGWTSTMLAALAPLAALVLVLVAFGAPLHTERLLEMPLPNEPKLFQQLAPYLLATALLAVLLIAFLFGLPRLSATTRRAALVCFVLADVLTYALNASYAAPRVSSYNGSTTAAKGVRAATGPNGRFAIFDPLFSFPPTGMSEPDSIGLPDINILQRTSSVEGYGSIVDSAYQNATATHGVEDLNQNELAGSTFDSLDLAAFITLPVYIWRQLGRGVVAPVAGVGTGTHSPAAPPHATGPYILRPGQSQTFVMAKPSALVRATAILDPAAHSSPTTLRIIEGDRVDTGAPQLAVHDGVAVQGFPKGVVVDSVVVENSSDVAAVIGAVTIVTRHPAERYVLDGWLQGDLAPPHWRYDAVLRTRYGDNFVVFRNTESAGPAWLQRDGTTRTTPLQRVGGSSVRVLHEPIGSPQTMVVDTPVPAELVRSVEYASGWSATITPAGGGAARTERARVLGLVQMVQVPAGRSVVTWRYGPRSLHDGALLSLVGVLALAAIPAAPAISRRRRRRQASDTEE